MAYYLTDQAHQNILYSARGSQHVCVVVLRQTHEVHVSGGWWFLVREEGVREEGVRE